MVTKRNKSGRSYREPPISEKKAEFYRRVGGGPVAYTRPGKTFEVPKSQALSTQESLFDSSAATSRKP
jgi:hypothetical protein